MSNTKVSSEQIIDDVALGGNPTTTTQSASDNSTKVATTAYVTTAVSNLIDSAPSSLNTLNELAAAMNDNASFFSTVLPLSGGTMTGNLIVNAIVDADNFKINGAQGNDGQVLTSTGSGVAWEDASSFDADAAQTFNDSGAAVDFRIEGDTEQNLFFLDGSADKIGIGTASPDSLLDIESAHSQLRLTDSDDSKFVLFSYSGGKLIVRNNSTNTTANQVTLLENGRFGIGTINPDSQLHVDASHTGTLVTFHQTAGASGDDRGLDVETSSTGTTVQRWFNSGQELMRVNGTGNVSIGTTGATNRLTVSDAQNISMSSGAAGQLRIEGNGYSGAIALDGSAMHIYQNSSARDIIMGNNETAQFKIHRTGEITAPYHPIFDVSIGAAGSGVRVFNVTNVNIGSNYSTSNGRFTAPVAGTYFFQTAFIKNNSTAVARRRFNKNGSALYSSRQMRMDSGQSYGDPGTLAAIVTLAVGDYIQVDQYAGESIGGSSYDYFHGYLIA